ncbi:hypothetical protein FRC17_004562 [Serendipita sp. 399]|nr:hypothetical protein FRC17_004562 [Serendipita sp. 399]
MAQRAGGLYGGIKFSSSSALPSEQIQSTSTSQAPSSSTNAAIPTARPTAVIEAGPTTATKVPQVSREKAEDSSEIAPKASAGWSAALAFAPVRRQTKPKTAARALPPGAAMVASLAMAAAAATESGAPTTTDQSNQEPESAGWGKKIKAPSMVLDEDVNGFRSTRPGEGKRKKKKKINANQINWDPMEPYDPFFPNDYHEYKNFKQRQREERRMQERRRVEDLKRRREDNRSDYTSDSYSDDGRPSRKTARHHSPELNEDEYDLRRGLGLSAFHSSDQDPMDKDEELMDLAPPAPIAQDETGEEAYLRRVRMSQRTLRPPSPPAPKSAPVPAFVSPTLTAGPTQNFPPPDVPIFPIQSPSPPAILPPPQFKPPEPAFDKMDDEEVPGLQEQASPIPPLPPPTSAPLSQAVIDERKKAAAAIAARLAALSKPPPPMEPAFVTSPPPPASQSSDLTQQNPAGFAARLMAKYGYVEGQGLGVNADGIVEPIMLEKNLGPKGGKKGDVDGSGKKGGVGGMGIGGARMGRIVNSQADEKNRADIARYGESSRIVLLTNIVSPEDVDDDLQGEIGKYFTAS